MSKLLGITETVEMEKDEDDLFVPSRKVWVTTPDGRLCDGGGPAIIMDRAAEDLDPPYDWAAFRTWYANEMRREFEEAQEGVRVLLDMEGPAVASLAQKILELIDDEQS